MAKDKGEGEETKPSSEAEDVARIQDDTVKARETEAKDISSFQPSKKEISLPATKTQSRCRPPQIFGATKLGFHPAPCVICAQMWRRIKVDQANQQERGYAGVLPFSLDIRTSSS